MSTTKRLTESFAAPLAGGKVDAEAGIIRDVLLCGTRSENGRRYPWGKGLTCDPAKYEGRHVYDGHQKTEDQSKWIGVVRGVRVDDQGRPRGDIHLLTAKEAARAAMEAVAKFPESLGMSHVAMCRTRFDGGVEVIESVERVESVDIVLNPATRATFRESIQAMPTTLRKFLEGVGSRKPAAALYAKAKFVREMDEMPMDLPAEPMGDADMDPAAGITEAFRTAISSIVDAALSGGTDPKEALSKIKKMLAAHGDINGDGVVDEADVEAVDADEPDGDEMPAAMESVLAAFDTLAGAGLKVTRESLALVTRMPAQDRPAFAKLVAESEPATKPAERPTTTGRTDAKALTEHAAGKAAPAGAKAPTAKEVIESIKGR